MASQSYFLNGDATAAGNNCYNITNNIPWQNGTVWYANLLDLNQPFSLEFYMRFGTQDANGADGMVFVLQTIGTNAIGLPGGGLGYEGFNNSFGIEFDTYDNNPQNNNGDMAADHVAFFKNGNIAHNNPNNLAGPVQANSTNVNIEDNQEHIIKITWNPATNEMKLFFDCVLRITNAYDIIDNIFSGNPNVYWGFTGSTGGLSNQQSVCLEEYYLSEINEQTICEGLTTQLAASGNPEGTFAWTPTTGLSNATSQTPTASPNVSTQYCCTYTDLCGVQAQQCVDVNIVNFPEIDAGNDTSFCTGGSIELNASIAASDNDIIWTTSNGNMVNGSQSSSPLVNEPGTYTITVTTTEANCSASDDIVVIENTTPIIDLDSPVFLCPDSSVVLNAGAGWTNILWSTSANTPTIVVTTAGNYTATVTENNCSASSTIVVSQVNVPNINLGPDVLVCQGTAVILDAGANVNWNTGQQGNTISVNENGTYACSFTNQGCSATDEVVVNFEIPPSIEIGPDIALCPGESAVLSINTEGLWSTGEFASSISVTEEANYSVTVSDGVCSVTDNVAVTVLFLPVAQLGNDVVYCEGTTVTLSALDPRNETYAWSTGDTDGTIEITVEGDYFVTTSNNCGEVADTISIQFQECNYIIYTPNAFTPNNDGINDVWQVEARNLTKTKLTIYDRWGQVIFSTTDLLQPWTGNVLGGGHYAQEGVYTYLLEYWATTIEASYLKGHITLIR
jgi:gliding motility-associated-like protein